MSNYKKPRSFSDYIRFYYLENYLFDSVSKNFHKRGYLTPQEFFCIVIWKANRKKTQIRDAIRKRGISIEELTAKINRTKIAEKKMSLLTEIKHIGIPMASAILTVLYPKDFTVLDYRVWDDLKDKFVVEGRQPDTIKEYLEYVDVCKMFSKKYNKSLRDIDRFSWGRSFYRDLIKFLENKK
ncbi:MAG: hypothetical protein ABII19_04365 [Patescibacteria group bacterium]